MLTTRPQKSGANYASIWNREQDESPLRTFTRGQAEKLAAALADLPEVARRMGHALRQPLDRERGPAADGPGLRPHPHLSALPAILGNDDGNRQRPAVPRADEDAPGAGGPHACRPIIDEPVYIDALARSLERHLATLDFEPEVVLASYHGIPKPYFEKGDPYHCHCQKTTRLLREKLGWDEKKLITTFQSRFGAQEWLQPYTDKTVERLAQGRREVDRHHQSGLLVDCIETLDEIGREVRDEFLHAGGKNFAHIPCLNDSPEGMDGDRDAGAARVVGLGLSRNRTAPRGVESGLAETIHAPQARPEDRPARSGSPIARPPFRRRS